MPASRSIERPGWQALSVALYGSARRWCSEQGARKQKGFSTSRNSRRRTAQPGRSGNARRE